MNERDGQTPNERTRQRRERRRRAMQRLVADFDPNTPDRQHLFRLFRRQRGLCGICGTLALLGKEGPERAVRFRTGSRFGAPGRVRPRIMVHWKCANGRAAEIEQSLGIDELRFRARTEQTVTFVLVEDPS